MTPTLIAPPSQPVVVLLDLREHLRVEHSADDNLIEALERAAVAHLDGWTGILGRCIMPQTWQVSLPGGVSVLPFPDVVSATVTSAGVTQDIVVTPAPAGPEVNLSIPGDVRFTCAMPSHLLPAAQVAVKMWVAEAYENRDASVAGTGTAFRAIVSALRWQGT